MKNRRKTALAIRADWDEQDKLRYVIYERASGAVLSYYYDIPKRGCIAGRAQLSRAIADIQIEE